MMEEVAIKVLGAPRCHLGEGPCYDPARDVAWWVDILERRLFEVPLSGAEAQVHRLPFMASGIATIDGDHQLLAAEDGLYVRTIADGRVALNCPLEADDGDTRSNDGRVHPSGALWISTMSRTAEAGRGAIYHVSGTRVTRLYAGMTIPNAICFSPDGSIGYFADSRTNQLLRVAVDPKTGLPAGEPSPLHDHRGEGCIDGAAVDADGLIWSSRWGAACVDAYRPDGQKVRTITLPARQPSCPTFAGAGLNQLLVTSAYEGMDEGAKEADPHHGRTFLVDVGVRGLLEPRFTL